MLPICLTTNKSFSAESWSSILTFQGNSSQFALDPNTTGSVWQIDGQDAPATKKEAYGSVYGHGGEKIGGVWKLDAPAGQGEAHATGIFEVSR